mmetsp:Transcript_24554/g.67986  ORF Transcript_24554/g.67986 Transcript_24554/m.67986 type:complete len:93 (+) Transcript_24554:2562-2840(+)
MQFQRRLCFQTDSLQRWACNHRDLSGKRKAKRAVRDRFRKADRAHARSSDLPATDKELKIAKPTMNWFLGEFRSMYWRLERPTATIKPKSAQ